MIALKFHDGGSVFQVYDDDKLIAHIRKQKGLTGDRYLASIHNHGQEESYGKEFDSPDDALRWIEKQITV
jgi:hypothetical protein